MHRSVLSLAFIALLLPASLAASQQIPKTELTTLTGQRLTIPIPSSTKPLLLLLTFSHKGSGDVAALNKHFKVRYETNLDLDYYELSDFQGVPHFIMRMILHGMRRATPEPERSHSAPFYTHEKEWEKLVGYNNPKISYIVLADSTGHVVWQIHGPATDTKTAELDTAVQKLLQRPATH